MVYELLCYTCAIIKHYIIISLEIKENTWIIRRKKVILRHITKALLYEKNTAHADHLV